MKNLGVPLFITAVLVLGAIAERDAKVLLAWLVGLSFAGVLKLTANLYASRREDRLAESFDREEKRE